MSSDDRCGCGCPRFQHVTNGCVFCNQKGRICTGFKLAEFTVKEVIARPDRIVLSSAVDHPSYYGGESNPYEAIKVIEAWGLDFCLGNAVKYISRAGKKDPAKELEDLEKSAWYLQRRIEQLKTK